MKPLQLLILIQTLAVFHSIAQNYQQNYGLVKLDELLMTSYDRDKAAEALVLYDIGNTYFDRGDNGFRIVFERSTKIKVFTKAGFDYTEIEIPFYFSNEGVETVYDIEGFTYNIQDGAPKTTRFNPENVFEEKQSELWRLKKFAMPDVKEGSVIEFRYKINSPFIFNLRDWDFQRKIPIVYSEYTTRMIPFYEYTFLLQGAPKFDVFKNYQDNMSQQYGSTKYVDNIYVYGMKNVPAFRDEDFITSINDYIIKLDFQLAVLHYPTGGTREIITKWPMLIQDMLKMSEFGGFMRSISKNSEELLSALALSNMENRAKTEVIYKYVVNNFNWDGVKDKVAYKSAKNFLKEKTGNSSEINLFLSALLNAAGIKAFPVLLSTRDHGKIPIDYPFQHFLNYVIVLVRPGGQDLLLDATEPLGSFGTLPTRCINEKGLIVNEDQVEWINLVDNNSSEINDSIRITYNKNLDSLITYHHVRSTGHDALRLRRKYADDPVSLGKEFIKEGIDLSNTLSVTHERVPENPFLIDFSTLSEAEVVGDKLLITPFAGLAPEENPLKLPFRSYPVDLTYKRSRQFKAFIDIPSGYTYVMQNRDLNINNALVNIFYKINNSGKMLEIEGSYTFKKPVYLKHEYYDIKDYFNRIVTAFNDPVVLVRE